MFSGLFPAMCTAIALKLCTWLYFYDLQIKFEDGRDQPFFRRVMPLELSQFLSALFSSPELKAQVSFSDRPLSGVCLSVCLSVCKLLHFRLLLQNRWANFNQKSKILTRSRKCKLLHFRLLLQNRWANFNQIWHKSSLGEGDSSLFKGRG
jgi:hypothetical protein